MISIASGRILLVIGGGEHAVVVVDAARSEGWRVIGFTDPLRGRALEMLGLPWLGDDDAARDSIRLSACVIGVGGIGDGSSRIAIAGRTEFRDATWGTVIHSRAIVSDLAKVSEGAVVLGGAIVNPGASVGAHAIINTGAIVEHDVSIGEFAHVAPGAVIGGGARVGRGASVGLGARIRDHVEIGDAAVVGMGAVVLRSVRPRSVVIGVPARERDGERAASDKGPHEAGTN